MRDSILELVKEKDEFEVIVANKGGEEVTGVTTKGPRKGAKPVVWLQDVAARAEQSGVSAEDAYAEIKRALDTDTVSVEVDMESVLADVKKSPMQRLKVRLVKSDTAPDFQGYAVKKGPFALTFISELTVAGNEGTFVVPDVVIEEILANEHLTGEELANAILEKTGDVNFIGMWGLFPCEMSMSQLADGKTKIFAVTNKDVHHGAVNILSAKFLSLARMLEQDMFIFVESSDTAFVALDDAFGDSTLRQFADAMRFGRMDAGPIPSGHFISDDIYKLDALTGEVTVAVAA